MFSGTWTVLLPCVPWVTQKRFNRCARRVAYSLECTYAYSMHHITV